MQIEWTFSSGSALKAAIVRKYTGPMRIKILFGLLVIKMKTFKEKSKILINFLFSNLNLTK